MLNPFLRLAVGLALFTSVARAAGPSAAEPGWFPFNPPPLPAAGARSETDLRFLNETLAGDNGVIAVKDGQFAHPKTGELIRFWAVNGPPHDLTGDALKECARTLARYGVNMVRIHGGYFTDSGEVDLKKIQHAQEIVEAMKQEGIYSHFSIYFPLWISPKSDNSFLTGYNGGKHPFASLFFNPEFQAQYRKWWTALLTTPNPATGKTLGEDPSVAGLEMQNEDSFFFWSFNEGNIPDPQLSMLEVQFADWLKKKYTSLDAAFARWNNLRVKRDAPNEGRVGFRPLWNLFSEKTARDQDTARFLFETQERFYAETKSFLRKLGFKGPITASNWSTASPAVLGPIEKLSYLTGDFVDRHGYFSCNHKGDNAEWSIREQHTYSDRSALRFDSETPGGPRQFIHPGMDPHYNNLPSMISETTWTRPNRFRGEAPLYLAAFGALQHSDAIIHFALDGATWSVKPGFWMQPWTVMSPAMMGQFPAAALIYRKGLVTTGEVLARVTLNRDDVLNLKGTPLPQDASLDELRLKDLPQGSTLKPGQRIDPLIHYAGRTDVLFTNGPGSVWVADLKPLINHETQTVTSSTHELLLDYAIGTLRVDAPKAQGASGSLLNAKRIETRDLIIESGLSPGHIIAVALDDKPLATSGKILLQVMSEEKATGFQTEDLGQGKKRILKIGTNPWLVKNMEGLVKFKRADAAALKVTPLDLNGVATTLGQTGAGEIRLNASTVYYLISK